MNILIALGKTIPLLYVEVGPPDSKGYRLEDLENIFDSKYPCFALNCHFIQNFEITYH